MNRNQWDNFQKLRYWGLVTKAQDGDGKRIGGTWAITQAGREFVEGATTIFKVVQTYRGETTGFFGKQVTFTEAQVGYKTRADYAADAEEA